MKLLQFGEVTFPYNPTLLRIALEERRVVHTVVGVGEVWESLGKALKLVEGEGVFFGEGASSLQRYLLEAMEQKTAALLCLPDLKPFWARLVSLQLVGKGGRERYAFHFCFWEEPMVAGVSTDWIKPFHLI